MYLFMHLKYEFEVSGLHQNAKGVHIKTLRKAGG